MVIYADVIFLRELLFDGFILLLTAWVRGLRPKAWRLLLAATIGAMYTVLMLFPSLAVMYHFLIKLFVSLIMIYVCFGFYSLQKYLIHIISFYIISFVLAGGLMGIYYMLMNSSKQVWANIIFVGGDATAKFEISLFYLVATMLIIAYLWCHFIRNKKKQQLIEDHFAEVEIIIFGDTIKCKGLIDTGNQLYDPLTNTPVLIIEVEQLAFLLPEALVSQLKRGEMNSILNSLTEADELESWRERLRIVPYRGVNRNSQFMLAIRPDKVIVHYNSATYEAVKVLIGFDGGQLSADRSYQMIVHPSLISNQTSSLG